MTASQTIRLKTPFRSSDVEGLKVGDSVLISGVIYSARDAAHKRMVELLDSGKSLPIDVSGQVIYYMGPSPARPGRPVGAAGPTTSYRMDPYAPRLIERGLKGMIGKGTRSKEVKEAMQKHTAVYFAAIGGAGALISKCIRTAEIIDYEDLGPEALRRLEVVDFPAIVAADCHGADIYDIVARVARGQALNS